MVDQEEDAPERAESAQTIELDSVLDIRAAGPLLEAFKAARKNAISVNAENVERIGALCAQVLVSAKQSWSEDECVFDIFNPSDPFRDDLETLGLSERLLS